MSFPAPVSEAERLFVAVYLAMPAGPTSRASRLPRCWAAGTACVVTAIGCSHGA